MSLTFGPVPSRRLGRSLGMNNIPPKTCTYSCVYCQVGRTTHMRVEPAAFYEPSRIAEAVSGQVEMTTSRGETIDYLTFVPDGEPTLDRNLGREIDLLRPLGIPIAVITNASLIWRPDVREALMGSDWVSLKVDAVDKALWRRVDRPHGTLRLDVILDGMRQFAAAFSGELTTETMLVGDLNDREDHLHELASFLCELGPSTAYLAVPTRPPAEERVRAPDEETIHRAYQIVSAQVERVEYLIGYEGNAFGSTGCAEDDLLSITAVHPMRDDAVAELVARTGEDRTVVRRLVDQGRLVQIEYGGHTFYMRSLNTRRVPGREPYR